MKRFLLLFPLFFALLPAQFPGAEGPHTSVRLIAEADRFVPGQELLLGIEMTMDDHWHTYWLNPGDSGMPTSVEWELPEGFSVGDLQWPVPSRYDVGGLISLGYEGITVLVVSLQTPEGLAPGEQITLRGRVSWLECKEACVPGDGDISLTLTAASEPATRSDRFMQALAALPEAEPVSASLQGSADGGILRIPGFGEEAEAFFPAAEGIWQLNPAPEISRTDDGVAIRLVSMGSDMPQTVRGLLRLTTGDGVWVEASTEAAGSDAAIGPPAASAETRGLAYYLFMSFVAGVAMNLLPCIFPVLGLKISSFVEQAQGGHGSVRTHAVIFGLGVLISMWVLAAGVSILGGAWGAQFQDPNLVIGMLLVLTFFTMNLFGVFELGLALTTVGGELSNKQGYAGSFFQGVLLTVVGTPCTGPLLVLVMAWMLAQPLWVVFLVFTLLGLGLASPYVLLAFSPPLLDRLPPPGNWMVTFKKASAFALVGFLWVLIYVLKGLIPVDGTVQVLGAMMLVCLAAWILGTWDTPARRPRTRRVAKVVVLLVLAGAVRAAYKYHVPVADLTPELEAQLADGTPVRWSDVTPRVAETLAARGTWVHYQPWSPERVEELVAEGRPVFVDFTADWCTICKLNKLRALHKDEVMQSFSAKGVATLRADWTGRDPVIAAVLESFGRRGVPVYLLYDGKGGAPVLLPENLSPETISEALDKL
jgi:thiol:disulfide interchange protein DsbD